MIYDAIGGNGYTYFGEHDLNYSGLNSIEQR